MDGPSDIGKAETSGDEGGLDPREAARLLAQTRRQAQRALGLPHARTVADRSGGGVGRVRRGMAIGPPTAPLHRANPGRA